MFYFFVLYRWFLESDTFFLSSIFIDTQMNQIKSMSQIYTTNKENMRRTSLFHLVFSLINNIFFPGLHIFSLLLCFCPLGISTRVFVQEMKCCGLSLSSKLYAIILFSLLIILSIGFWPDLNIGYSFEITMNMPLFCNGN